MSLWLPRTTAVIPIYLQQILRSTCTYRQKVDFAEVDIGQPTPYSHPHLFESKDELTPGITHTEYSSRRLNLLTSLFQNRIGKNYERHVVILTANENKMMSNDIPYPFHQDVDFMYLTGLNESDAIAVFEISRMDTPNFLLFVKPKDPKRELWDGAVVGEQSAVEYFNADEAFPLSSFHSILKERYGCGSYCFWTKKVKGLNTNNEKLISDVLHSSNFSKKSLEDVRHSLQMLRLIKSNAESNIMRKSASIGAKAFVEVMKNCSVGVSEALLHSVLEFECKVQGANCLSFPPVVAGGNRANTLHYIKNDQILRSGDLVLMDGGCEYNHYPCDITRTWPVNGKFSKPQKHLYEIVLRVQKACLEKCSKEISINHLHHIMLMLLGEELQDIGFIQKRITDVELQREASKFCPHHLGHYLGMDTHDTPLLNRGLSLQTGMTFTLEPGLYVSKDAVNVPEQYRGIGIRIEDDILMTNDGPFVLTHEAPKDVDAIENLISEYAEKRLESKL